MIAGDDSKQAVTARLEAMLYVGMALIKMMDDPSMTIQRLRASSVTVRQRTEIAACRKFLVSAAVEASASPTERAAIRAKLEDLQ